MPENVKQKPGRLKFIKSAADLSGWPMDSLPEVALAGRSNAGKSSFLNGLQGSSIAKVSGKPGKTRLLNFFSVEDKYRLVDMPGYGWASVSAKEMKQWQAMIEAYLLERENLVGLLLIMDVRRKWTEDEQMLVDLMDQRGLPSAVILSKADKLKRGPGLDRRRKLKKEIERPCFLSSSLKKQGFYEVEDHIYKNWIETAPEEEEEL